MFWHSILANSLRISPRPRLSSYFPESVDKDKDHKIVHNPTNQPQKDLSKLSRLPPVHTATPFTPPLAKDKKLVYPRPSAAIACRISETSSDLSVKMTEPEEIKPAVCAFCGDIEVEYSGLFWTLSDEPTESPEWDEWFPVCKECAKKGRPKSKKSVKKAKGSADGPAAVGAKKTGKVLE